jgi:hypothetical protein
VTSLTEDNVPPFADCYVLVNSRSKKLVQEFLAHFLPKRRAWADEYEVPQYSDKPEQVFRTTEDALAYLEEHPHEHHGLYWANEGRGDTRRGMVFPTSDGEMIYGLSCDAKDPKIADKLLDAMKLFLKSEIGCIAIEEPPPESAQGFKELVESLGKE